VNEHGLNFGTSQTLTPEWRLFAQVVDDCPIGNLLTSGERIALIQQLCEAFDEAFTERHSECEAEVDW